MYTYDHMENISPFVHIAYMGPKDRVGPISRRTYPVTYLRVWREFRGLTLQTLADRIGTTHASLSRIERGKQPYSQSILEDVARELRTDPASLIVRNPEDADSIWAVWEQAKPADRRIIIDLAKTIIKRNT